MDTFFFVLSKIFWFLARPESWIVGLLVVSVVGFWRGHIRRGQRFLWASIGFILIVGTVPLGELVMQPLEAQFLPSPEVEDPVGIIILGGGEDARGMRHSGLPQITGSGDRLLEGLLLSVRYPAARMIFTGGSSSLVDQSISGSEVAERVFEDAGIDPDRVRLERAARNTAENATLTRDLVGDPTRGPWLLVTSAFHMPRAVGSFCAAGWQNVVPYPVDFRSVPGLRLKWDLAGRLSTLNTGIKEWIGLLAYRVTGRSTGLFPETC